MRGLSQLSSLTRLELAGTRHVPTSLSSMTWLRHLKVACHPVAQGVTGAELGAALQPLHQVTCLLIRDFGPSFACIELLRWPAALHVHAG
jgi:hypothetical protein